MENIEKSEKSENLEVPYIQENKCYNFEDIINENGLFDDCLDATYIIYLEGNEERKSNIKNQLYLYQPTKKIHILNNKGFKKCKKVLKQQLPRCDLIDCFIHIFKDAQQKKYNNILILEDDFIFSKEVKNQNNIEQITKFINNCTKNDQNFIYLLGCIPYLQIPSLIFNHTRVIASTGTQSSIYSKKFREEILNISQDKIDDWDIHTNFNSPYTFRYIYKIPLCYQLFYETDNFKSWDDLYNFKYIIMNIFKKLDMDKNPEPGFSLFYLLSKIIFYLIIIIIYFGIKSTIQFIIFITQCFYSSISIILS